MRAIPARPHPDFRPRPSLGQAGPPGGDLAETLRRQGAVVEVEIAAPASASQAATPPGQTVRALIDTGASISTVEEGIAASAGLVPTGTVQLGGVGGSGQRTVYAAAVALPAYGVRFDPIEVAGVSVPMPGIQMLLGRDMLKRLRLDYTGPAGVFALEETDQAAPGTGAPPSGPSSPVTPILIGAGAAGAVVAALALLGAI